MAKNETYEEFVEKFKRKKTTDDCYTPQAVFEEVEAWVRENARSDIRELVTIRPFYPDGDYESVDYEGRVVIDNPPFSIYSQIVKYYTEREIPFFLFGPGLTVAPYDPMIGRETTVIITDSRIKYDNGAVVNTGFVTNLFGDAAIMLAPDLKRRIKEAQTRTKEVKEITKIEYPEGVITPTLLTKYVNDVNGRVEIKHSECRRVNYVGTEKTKLFGGGFLVGAEAAKRLQKLKLVPRELRILLTAEEEAIRRELM